jgi:hypothetical protein
MRLTSVVKTFPGGDHRATAPAEAADHMSTPVEAQMAATNVATDPTGRVAIALPP